MQCCLRFSALFNYFNPTFLHLQIYWNHRKKRISFCYSLKICLNISCENTWKIYWFCSNRSQKVETLLSSSSSSSSSSLSSSNIYQHVVIKRSADSSWPLSFVELSEDTDWVRKNLIHLGTILISMHEFIFTLMLSGR